MEIGDYTLINPDKLERAINGSIVSGGQVKGGVGPSASSDAILAEYDRLGGAILYKGQYHVKLGGFYDFKNKCAFKKPAPVLDFRFEGEVVEVPVGDPLPLEIRASEQAKARKAEKAAAKRKGKPGRKKKDTKADSDEEGEEDADDEEVGEVA